MKTRTQCAACIIDDLQGALMETVVDQDQRVAILAEAMAWLGTEFGCDAVPSYYITGVHRLLKQRTGLCMPFEALRARCNEVGMSVSRRVTERLARITDPAQRLRLLCLWAIAGNHLDFRTVGTGYAISSQAIEAQLAKVVSEGLAIDHTGALTDAAGDGTSVLYLCDNVGEIALDRLLIEELGRRGCKVKAAVKGGPITSDAVMADARRVGLAEVADVILAGPDTLGLPLWGEMSSAAEDALQAVDLVISKGQANYYALSEIYAGLPGKVFCLLRTKCQPVAASLGFPADSKISVVARLDQTLG